MSFDEVKVKPGANVNLNVGASPSSTCFVGMLDKSVTLLGGNNQLTPGQVRPSHTRSNIVSYIAYKTLNSKGIPSILDKGAYGKSNFTSSQVEY
jgi:hypothetical protein